ncbi:head-tail connector protein [Antarcticirhabdus aurantiaca]|uniref:Head-tail connector protein n=1 Tax=Antarcticirhabdus aurantiaca TaxID=2606717 RepID=A0ACD4NVE1_9HYPH|nr:head-tail connector protein [Jeongeuplla avenae]
MFFGEGDFIEHLNMTADEASAVGSQVLRRLLAAAEAHTEAQLGFKLDDEAEFPGGPPHDVEQAVFMLAAFWFEQRESVLVAVSAQITPHGYDDIIRSHRSYTFG